MSEPRRILALDVGAVRIGVAVSDDERRVASPLTVIQRKNRDADVAAVGRLAREQGAGLLVVGLPKSLDDGLDQAGEKILRLGRRLERALGLPVVFVAEAVTTVEAQEALLEADLSRARRRQVVDKVAASLILRRYLDGEPEERP